MKGCRYFKHIGTIASKIVLSFVDKYDILPSSTEKKYFVIKYKFIKELERVEGVAKKGFSFIKCTPEKAIEKAKIYIKEQEAKDKEKKDKWKNSI